MKAGQLRDDLVRPGRDSEQTRALAAGAEILAIEVERRAGRVGRDREHGDVRFYLRQRRRDPGTYRGIRLLAERRRVVAKRFRVAPQLLVRPRDVVDDVPVRNE